MSFPYIQSTYNARTQAIWQGPDLQTLGHPDSRSFNFTAPSGHSSADSARSQRLFILTVCRGNKTIHLRLSSPTGRCPIQPSPIHLVAPVDAPSTLDADHRDLPLSSSYETLSGHLHLPEPTVHDPEDSSYFCCDLFLFSASVRQLTELPIAVSYHLNHFTTLRLGIRSVCCDTPSRERSKSPTCLDRLLQLSLARSRCLPS